MLFRSAWQNNYFLAGNVGHFDYRNYNARLDHTINSKHRLFGRWSWFPEFEYRIVNGISGLGGDYRTGDKINHGVMLDLVSALSPTTVFNIRLALNRWLEDKGPHRWPGGYPGWKDATQLGWPRDLVSQLPDPARIPYFSAELYGTLGTASGQTNYEPTNVLSVQPNWTLVRGRHTVKTGLDFRDRKSVV